MVFYVGLFKSVLYFYFVFNKIIRFSICKSLPLTKKFLYYETKIIHGTNHSRSHPKLRKKELQHLCSALWGQKIKTHVISWISKKLRYLIFSIPASALPNLISKFFLNCSGRIALWHSITVCVLRGVHKKIIVNEKAW